MYICIPASVSARAARAGRYDAAAAARYLESGAEDEAGSEDAFELLHEIGERVRTLPYSIEYPRPLVLVPLEPLVVPLGCASSV